MVKLHEAREQGVTVLLNALSTLSTHELNSNSVGWEYQESSGAWTRYPDWLCALFTTYGKGSGDKPASITINWEGRRYQVDFGSMSSRQLPRRPGDASLIGGAAGLGRQRQVDFSESGAAARATPLPAGQDPRQGGADRLYGGSSI